MRQVDELRTSRVGRLAGISAASVGVIYGYDLSNIAGALRYITDEFHLSTHQQEMVTAAVVIGQIAGAISGGLLANAIGRKKSMVLVVAGYAAFAVLSAAAMSVPMLLAARLLLGLTIGVSVVVVPVFIAECAPARVRGSLLVAYQLATVCGVIAGYLAAYLLADAHSWRWMLALAAVPAVLILLLLLPMPDTARWYMLKGWAVPARQVLRCVEPEADVEEDLAEIARALSEESGGALTEMLRRPYLRATIFVVGLGFFAHITGINAIILYSPRLFAAMGFTGNFALLVLPALVQVAGLVAVVASLILVDRLGRRPILLSGIAMMTAADALLIIVFASASGFTGFAGLL
ncbi:MAG: MFS transporter, partial [Mycobacterium sp.]